MGQDSKIEWTDHTFNPWRGCTKVSEGCRNCYAETLSGRNPGTLGVWGPSGTRVVAAESAWKEPLKWDRAAKAAGARARVFCASLADVFEDWPGKMVDSQGSRLVNHAVLGWTAFRGSKDHEDETDNWLTMDDVRDRLFDLITETEHLDWLLVTKRPERVAAELDRQMTRRPFIVHDSAAGPRQERRTTWKEMGVTPAKVWPNLWLGTSVENQKAADERIPELLQVPAAVRFLSMEPLLGPVDLRFGQSEGEPTAAEPCRERCDLLHWVIVGGESGAGSRPCHWSWVKSVVNQCRKPGVPVFVKQLGAVSVVDVGFPPPRWQRSFSVPVVAEGGRVTLKLVDKKGGDPAEWPEDLRVREFPMRPTP